MLEWAILLVFSLGLGRECYDRMTSGARNLALHEAASKADRHEVDRLLAAGANPHAHVTERAETALHAACRSDESGDCCRRLLRAGADSSARCIHGGNCLHQAGQFMQEAALIALLGSEEGASLRCVNMQDKNGWTPLHATVYKPAQRHRRLAMVAALLRAGADAGLRNSDGNTPMDLARAFGHADAVEALELGGEAGAETSGPEREF